ncbi:RT RNaseH domain-containing protein [Abeliophyllum distichum]|uniref:RT RNaseH domain-containing protein n=1 Tax=Abeliophyllum distichum TaxID=126358 RepID=A0ABD1V5B3_9LAMI
MGHLVKLGPVLIILERHKLNYVFHFYLKATNNVAKYEALLAGLHLAKEMSAIEIEINSDSQLLPNGQVEAVNKTLKNILKRKLDGAKKTWADDLSQILWAYHTT